MSNVDGERLGATPYLPSGGFEPPDILSYMGIERTA
jgi:hypothetical protein